MVCKVCGTNNAEDAVFCKHCGRRLDGKLICKSCGAENDGDALFCDKCGTSFTAKSAVAVNEMQGEITLRPRNSNWKRVVEIIGWAFAMLGLLFVAIFTFLIGTRVTAGVDDYDLSDLLGNLGHNMYYFFSDVYKDINEKTASLPNAYKAAELLPAIIGTVAAAGVILAVCILTTVAICRFVAYVRGKSQKDFAKPTIAAYFMYVIGSLILLSVEHASISVLIEGITITAGLALNPATVAGIAVAGACLAVFILSRVINNVAKYAKLNNLLHGIFSVVSVALLAIVLVFLPRAGLGYSENDGTYGMTMSLPIMQYMEGLIIPMLPRVAKEMVLAVTTQIVQVVFLSLVSVAIIYQVCNVCQEKKNISLIFSIPVLLFAIAYLVLTVEYGKIVANYSGTDAMNYTNPIISLVFAVLAFALSVAQLFFRNKPQPAIEYDLQLNS